MRARWLVMIAIALAVGASAAIVAGVYDVAATQGHSAPVYHLMHFAMRRSVAARAQHIAVPALDDPARIRAGLRHFEAHCVQCHGAPGVAPDPVAIGMIPAPTNLVASARAWPAGELYWVVRHGIKMTAMPAWNYKLTDAQLWDVVAFLKVLPELSPAEYRRSASAEDVGAPLAGRAGEPLRPGRAEEGRRAIRQYLCATCHDIPGFPGTENEVGPPLGGFATRRYIGGVLLNTPANRVRWLLDPQAVDARSAMPSLGMGEQEARDIAAFLSELR